MNKEKKEWTLLSTMDDPTGLLRRKNCTYWEVATHWFAILILAVFPMLMGFRSYYDITESKFVIFKCLTVLMIIACGLILAGLVLERRLLKVRAADGWQKPSLPQILLVVFAFWTCLSALLSQYREVTWVGDGRFEGVCSMLLYTAVFLIVSFWGEYSDRYFYAMGMMAVVFGVIAVLQMYGIEFVAPDDNDFSTTYFLGTIGNIDCVGGIIAMALPVLGGTFALRQSKWRWYVCLPGYILLWYIQLAIDVDSSKLGLGLALLVMLPFLLTERRYVVNTLFLGGVTAAVYGIQKLVTVTSAEHVFTVTLTPGKRVWLMLAAAVVLFVCAWLVSRSDKPLRWTPKTIRRVTAAALLVCVLAGVVFIYCYGGSNRLLTEASQAMHGNLTDGAGSGRGIVWKNCFKLIGQAPLIGYGPGTFATVYEPYNTTLVFDFAHNDFIQIALGQGLIGLALYVAFIVSLAARALKWACKYPFMAIMGGAAAGYLLHSFFSFSIAIVTPLFWVLAGLLDKCVRQAVMTERAEKKTPAETGKKKK